MTDEHLPSPLDTVRGLPMSNTQSLDLCTADRIANTTPTVELLRLRPLSAPARRAVRAFRVRGMVRGVPIVGPVARAVLRILRGARS